MIKRHLQVGLAAVLALGTFTACSSKPPPPPPPPPPPVAQPLPRLEHITISDRIEFETGNAILLPQSLPVLNQVVEILKKHPEIELVEIQGHTDTVGDEKANLLLSQARAESVRTYMISQGILGERMRPWGHGDRVPVASNDTPQGRLQNRRVEFRIVKQAGQ